MGKRRDAIKVGRFIFDSAKKDQRETTPLASVNVMDMKVVIVAWTIALSNYFKAALETMRPSGVYSNLFHIPALKLIMARNNSRSGG